MAVLLVLLLLVMTLGLSYSAMRSQSVNALINRNAERDEKARQHARTAIAMGLRKMHDISWGGHNSTFQGYVGNYHELWRVSFRVGDPRLTESSPDYEDSPYRVTLTATGWAEDADNRQCFATHQARAVVRLIPRALNTEPAHWSQMIAPTAFQWNDGLMTLNPARRIEGDVSLRGELLINTDAGWTGEIRDTYTQHLNLRRLGGQSDWRPLNGALSLPYGSQTSTTISALGWLGIATTDQPSATCSFMPAQPTLFYRVFTAGRNYPIEPLQAVYQGVEPEVSVECNPLAIHYRNGYLEFRDDVVVRGTVWLERGAGDMRLNGKRIKMRPVDMPPLFGTTEPVRLPSLICGGDCIVYRRSTTQIEGLVTCYDTIDIDDGVGNTALSIDGGLIFSNLEDYLDSNWRAAAVLWQGAYAVYQSQRNKPTGIPLWCNYLAQVYGMSGQPRIVIKRTNPAYRYHWPTPNAPMYVPGPGDPGLRWELIDYTEKL